MCIRVRLKDCVRGTSRQGVALGVSGVGSAGASLPSFLPPVSVSHDESSLRAGSISYPPVCLWSLKNYPHMQVSTAGNTESHWRGWHPVSSSALGAPGLEPEKDTDSSLMGCNNQLVTNICTCRIYLNSLNAPRRPRLLFILCCCRHKLRVLR